MARKIPVLGRFLGAPALYAMAYGEIGSSLYYALGITAVYALSLTPAVFLAAGVIFALTAAAYAEGAATIPEPGGASTFARRAFNDLVGFIAGWATVLDYVISISLAALFLPHYVLGAIGQDTLSADQTEVLAVALILVITAARIARRTNVYMASVVLAVLDLVVQAGLALMGLLLLFDWTALTNNIDLGTKPTWNSLAFALPIAMIGFTGLEKVTGLVGLAKRPEKSVPDSIRSSVFTVILVYAAVATAAISAFPSHRDPSAPAGYASELTTRWLDAPMLGLATAVGNEYGSAAATAARFIVGVTASLILLLAITTSFSGAGRLSVAMGERLELPGRFAKRNRRSLQPTFALLGVGLLASASVIVAALFQGEEILSLASIYSFGILIAFGLANASIVWLRITEPDMPRPFMMRGNVWIRGRLIPRDGGGRRGYRVRRLGDRAGHPPGRPRRRGAVDDRRPGHLHHGARARRRPADGALRAGRAAARGGGRAAQRADRGAAGGTGRAGRGGDGHRLPAGDRDGRAGGRGQRHLRAGAGSAGRRAAGARPAGGRGAGRWRARWRRTTASSSGGWWCARATRAGRSSTRSSTRAPH